MKKQLPLPLDCTIGKPIVGLQQVTGVHTPITCCTLRLQVVLGLPIWCCSGTPLLSDESVVVDGTQHHHFPLVHLLQYCHRAVHPFRHDLSLLHFSFHLIRQPSPVLPHCATCTEPKTLEVTKESWTTVIVVSVDIVTSALQAVHQLQHYSVGHSNF